MTITQDIDVGTAELLQCYAFDAIPLDSLRKKLLTEGPDQKSNRITGTVQPPSEGDLSALPPMGTPARKALFDQGLAAIATGEVGAVVLAGGMATRFGGVVKAAVPVLDGKSFLELKLADAKHAAMQADHPVPVFLMTSFATDADVKRLAEEAQSDACPIEAFAQFISLRLTPEGELFIGDDGKASAHAPGHGDLTFALRHSGVLKRFRDSGGKVLFMSNVDNLTATLDPAIIGAHLNSGAAITAEMAPKEPGDKGGAPGRVDGNLQIIESFRFPESFDQDSIPVFNTNTLTFSAEAIDKDFPLNFFAVQKTVDGRQAIQFERLVGQLTALLDVNFIRVERHGPDARFQPIKVPDDIAKQEGPIRKALESRGIL